MAHGYGVMSETGTSPTAPNLVYCRCTYARVVPRKVKDGVRLLAKGEIKAKLDISVTGASKAAVSAVEKAGGKVTLTRAAEADTSEKAGKADKKGAKAGKADTDKEASA